jgi:hexosaminidase
MYGLPRSIAFGFLTGLFAAAAAGGGGGAAISNTVTSESPPAAATAALPTSAPAAPTVCHQYEESTGSCRDTRRNHDPLTHLWPKPVEASSTNTTALVLTNASIRFVAAGGGGGPILRAAIARYHAQLFAPVAGRAAADPSDASRPAGGGSQYQLDITTVATLTVRVRDAESAAPATEQDESYALAVGADGGGTLAANSSIGAIRGLETFAQLVEYSDAGDVQLWGLPISVVDRPRWKYRGIKIDTSRHFVTLNRLRGVVRAMEAAKMNVLQWHIIDGQSFPLESARFPQLAEQGRYCRECSYSQADVKALVAFARARGVRVIPELDMPGHSGFQYGMPEIVACPFFEAGSGSDRALDPTLDATYQFLTEFLTEQATLFGDPVINVYGDEVRFACWNMSASVTGYMRTHGIAAGDFQALTVHFWRRFATEVAPAVFNKTGAAVMIGEANVFGTDGPPFEFPQWLAAASPGYPLPLLVEVWGGFTLDRSANGTLRKVLATDGMQAVVGGPYYLDQDLPRPFPASASGGSSRNPAVFRAPYWVSVWRTMYAFDPVGDPALTAAQRAKVVGLVAEMWGEQIDSAVVEQRIFPHALAVAERGWTAAAHFAHGDIDYGEVEGRLDKPWAVKSLSADIHLNVRNNSYDCMYL